MKPLIIGGIALAALGVFVALIGPSYRSQQSMMRVGGIEVSAQSQRVIPPWVGWAAVVGGVVLAGAGMRNQRVAVHGTDRRM